MTVDAAPLDVLFVCGRNAIRSPMAETLWARSRPEAGRVASCGLNPAASPDPFMIAVMSELGEDLAEFEPSSLEDMAGAGFDLVISLSQGIDEIAGEYAAGRKARFLAWPTPDPSYADGSREQILDAYRECREALRERISAWAPETSSI
jgi:protein-tyrosine-phosphatase